MQQKTEVRDQPLHPLSPVRPMALGAGMALILIATFLLTADPPNPAWPKFWMVRPLIIVPLAGAMGGLFYYLLRGLRQKGGWRKALAILAGAIGYLVALWLGTVLGLDGTMWN